jgi:hypothetical protein
MSWRPDTAALLNEIREFLHRYLVLPSDYFYDVVALWVLHAWAIGAAETSPRLLLKSPEKESGKTRALELLDLLTPMARLVFNTSIAAIYRRLKETQMTLLVDECDAVFSARAGHNFDDLRALLNAGYRRSGTVDRVVGEGKKMRVEEFPVFAATALAAIGNLPDTIESRAIHIPMRRRAPDEPVESFRLRTAKLHVGARRDDLQAWTDINTGVLAEAQPAIPDAITDRAADCWEPLLAIAELAGEPWLTRAREAAVLIVKGRVAEDLSVGVRLLADIQSVLNGYDRLSSGALVSALNALPESAWGAWNERKGMTQRDLAWRLRPFEIHSKNIRLSDGSVPKGYLREDFDDAFSRYLRTATPSPSATSATSATSPEFNSASVADVADVADREGNGHVVWDDLAPDQLNEVYPDAEVLA